MQDSYGRHFLVESVMKALGMASDNILAIFGYRPITNPIGVIGKPGHLLIFDAHFEKTDWWFVLGIIHDFRIVFFSSVASARKRQSSCALKMIVSLSIQSTS